MDISDQKIVCPRHEIAFPINETVQELDVKEESNYIFNTLKIKVL